MPFACSITILEPSALSSWATRSSKNALEIVEAFLRGPEQRELAFVEVQEQRIDLRRLEPGADAVEQLVQQPGKLAELDLELPGAVVLHQLGFVFGQDAAKRLGV